jgi:hypothetical protein
MNCLKIAVLVVIEIIILFVVSFFWGGLQASINSGSGDQIGNSVVLAEICISFLACNIPIVIILIITIIRSMQKQAEKKNSEREHRQKLDEIDKILNE